MLLLGGNLTLIMLPCLPVCPFPACLPLPPLLVFNRGSVPPAGLLMGCQPPQAGGQQHTLLHSSHQTNQQQQQVRLEGRQVHTQQQQQQQI